LQHGTQQLRRGAGQQAAAFLDLKKKIKKNTMATLGAFASRKTLLLSHVGTPPRRLFPRGAQFMQRLIARRGRLFLTGLD
jgi:hypothetical protein